MVSTGFGRGGREGAMPLPAPFRGDPVLQGTTFRSTSAGLWGTAEDYLRFAEMLRSGGVPEGRRLLSQDAVQRMTTNRVGSRCPGLNGRGLAPGIGFGLSVAVGDEPAAGGRVAARRHLRLGRRGHPAVLGGARRWVVDVPLRARHR